MVAIPYTSNSSLCTPSSSLLGLKLAVDGPSAATVWIRFRAAKVSAGRAASSSSSSPYLISSRMASASTVSLYEVLGIPMGASYDEIKIAYRRLARVCHPDVVSMNLKDKSADEFMKIHAAYSTLSDPAKRADYDRKLFVTRKDRSSNSSFSSAFRSTTTTTTTVSGISGYGRRTWETDQCW